MFRYAFLAARPAVAAAPKAAVTDLTFLAAAALAADAPAADALAADALAAVAFDGARS